MKIVAMDAVLLGNTTADQFVRFYFSRPSFMGYCSANMVAFRDVPFPLRQEMFLFL